MAYATYEDVAVAIGRPITSLEEQAQVTYWLDAAELAITSRLGDVALLDLMAVRYVETEAAVVRMQNPNGYQSETIDDYTYRYGDGTREVSIKDAWWNLLDPQQSSGAFSVRPYFLPDSSSPSLDWS